MVLRKVSYSILGWKRYAAKKAGKWNGGTLKADEQFMARWHVVEENRRSERRGAQMRDRHSRKGVGGVC